jgi:DNA-binding NarL/FixJ family response regulator
MNFYVIIKNLFIQEGLKSILMNKFPLYSLNIVDSIGNLKANNMGESSVLIIDNPTEVFTNESKIKSLGIKKRMKTVLIANTAQMEQIKNHDLEIIDGLIYYDCSFHELDEALEKIMSGLKYRCKRLDSIADTGNGLRKILEAGQVSDREIEIIRLVISGSTSEEIADKLSISPHTVSTHRKNINKKLNIRTPHELIRMFMNADI